MDRAYKNITILILSIALIASGIGNMVLFSLYSQSPVSSEEKITLRAGTDIGPLDLDPVLSWDHSSKDVIEQVCEGLYMYNLSDPNLGIVPRLALDYGTWDVTGKHFTIPLRRHVWFHDGAPFNAEAVKWNFERINWFTNGTGTLNQTLSKIHSLWEFPNGTLILDPNIPITINNEYSVTINLRAPFAILESLICSIGAYMLSPKSTPKYEYISTATGRIVGTGPFVYDYYVADTEVKFHRWDRYWRTGVFFEELIIKVFTDATALNTALLHRTNPSVDYLLGRRYLLCAFCILPITAHYVRGFSYYYLSMNNKKINKTWRQVISYAINYTYIIEELQDWRAYRSNGPLAPTFPMYDPNIKAAAWDLAKARQILVNAGITNLIANNDTTGPVADAWKAADFQSWNYSYNIGNRFREDLGVLLKNNLDLIGIEVIDQGMSYDDFINRAYGYMDPGGYDSLELFWIGWGPDYLSPYNMIAPLFSNQSASNSCQYHNHTVEMWLDDVLSETNATKRAELYSKILHQIVEVDMPHAFGYHSYWPIIHYPDLKNIPYNPLLTFYAYPIYRDSNS